MVDKEQLPNLKICIDNTESDKEDGEIVSIHDEEDIPDSPIDFDLEEDDRNVEFSVRIGKTVRSSRSENRVFRQPSKVYENRSGDFITGIDVTEKEEILKKSERAKRFGIESKQSRHSVDLKGLYKSLGFHADDLKRDHRGIRLEAVHFRGVDNMHTQDIFKYFQEFGPGNVEWIDDASCNVVWMDNLTAARALLELSRSYDEVMKPYEADTSESEDNGHNNKDKRPTVKKKQRKKATSDEEKNVKKKDQVVEKEDTNKAVPMEETREDDDVLDLLDEEDNAKLTVHVNGSKKAEGKAKKADTGKQKEKKSLTKKKTKKKTTSPGLSSSSSSTSSSDSDSNSSSSSSSSSGSSSSSSGSGSSSLSSSGSSSSSSSDSSSEEDMDTDSKKNKKDKGSKAAKTKSKNKTETHKSQSKKSEQEKQCSKTESATRISEDKIGGDSRNKSKDEKSTRGNKRRDFPISFKPTDIPWPPGKWRLGLPYNKSKFLFLRYANKADKKLPGAEKRSKFYVKHGNPNYSGMKGFISNSRKRRIKSEQYREEVKEAREAIRAKRDAVSYDDVDIFGDDLKMETEEMDFGTSTTDSRKVAERLAERLGQSESRIADRLGQIEDRVGNVAGRLGKFHPIDEMDEGSDTSLEDDDDLDLLRSDKRRFEDKPVDPEAIEMEKELEVLLKSPPKKRPMMKMHADEEEEQMRVKKRRHGHGGLTITTDARSGGDARSLITGLKKPRHGGIDLRSKLKRDR